MTGYVRTVNSYLQAHRFADTRSVSPGHYNSTFPALVKISKKTIDKCIYAVYTYIVDVLPDPISFEWDKGNSDKNLKKHKVTNQEAEEVFVNDPKFILSDEKHSSEKETRHMLWGRTNKKRLLTIIFTIRKEKIRIISCRDMHKKERREYEAKS